MPRATSLSILRRQAGQPRFEAHDRVLLAAFSRMLPPRHSWSAFLVRPETLLHWHRRPVARRWTYPHRRPGRPPIRRDVRELILRLARENPSWGYQRIVGELRKLGVGVSATSVRNNLGQRWRGAGATARLAVLARLPNTAWMLQQARKLLMDLDDRERQLRFLIHDRDAKFPHAFDALLGSEMIKVIRTPVQAPNVNEHMERWVGSARRGCLDGLLILGRRQLENVLRVYVRYYNRG
jgi:putative transposase